jgi:hypothetical protein
MATVLARTIRNRVLPDPGKLLAIALIVGISLFLVGQITHPSSRVIKALVGLLLLIFAFRFRPTTSLVFFIVLFPFPFQVYLGSSNVLFILLVAMIGLARVALGEYRPLVRTPLDLPIATLLLIYLISFYHTENLLNLRLSVLAFVVILSTVFLYYMVVNFVRNEDSLRRAVNAIGLTILLANLVGIYEILFPGRVLIPHWILPANPSYALIKTGLRTGGPFRDFELYCEFTAMALPILIFLAYQAPSRSRRNFWLACIALDVVCMFSTVTRGGTIAAAIGVAYLLFRIRRRLGVTTFLTIIALSAIFPIAVANFLRAYTTTGSTFDRIRATQFIGVIPETRGHWPVIWKRTQEHILIGHGPNYDVGAHVDVRGHGLYKFAYPHNIYLWYLYTVGVIGLIAFLYLSWQVLRISNRWASDRLDGSYARGLCLALHVAIVIFLIDEGKVDYLRSPSYQIWPWLLIGLIVASARILERGEEVDGAHRMVTTPRRTALSGSASVSHSPRSALGAISTRRDEIQTT